MSASGLDELDKSSLEKILVLVHRYTGIKMGEAKKTMLQGRLRPRIRELGLDSYEHYLEYLNANKKEVQEFINLVTTNETSFFRTQRVWEFFTKEFLPRWTKENPKKTLRIWSGASSSGEEIYTIAICCEEHLLRNEGFNYQIIGTDISSDVLDVATSGKYSGRSIENFKSSNRILFDKYLMPNDGEFKFRDDLRLKINFKNHNLFNPPFQKSHFDIVFLRNVLIYFEVKDQEIVLKNVGESLVNDGLLIIGESESLSSLKTPFVFNNPLIYKKSAA